MMPPINREPTSDALVASNSTSLPQQQATENLNVTGASSIYEGGTLKGVSIIDLLGNEIAIRQLINERNLLAREAEDVKAEVQRLRIERAGYALQPALASFVGAVNILGIILVGLGINYLSVATPPAGAWIVLVVGAVLALLSTIATIVLPTLIHNVSKRD